LAYLIEVMSIGSDEYPLLTSAAEALNAVQHEFQYRVTSESQREPGISFEPEKYLSSDIWDFLRRHKETFGGNRPFIIAFVNAPLRSPEVSNLFGSHQAQEGFAAVTLYQSTQYVSEAKRYCCYWLVRYSLSFVNPLIKAHKDPTRKFCYFHFKDYKPDLRLSMDSGRICDECKTQLSDRTIAKPLSAEENKALKSMRDVVSGDFPHALIMKGGGVKGLAFAGALQEIEKYFWFDVHVGASAGAITAVLLAANYSPTELVETLRRKSFRDFLDARFWRVPWNLLVKQGLYPGEHFRVWMSQLLGAKIPGLGDIRMSDLPKAMRNTGKHAVIYACRRGSGVVVFDSRGERRDTGAAFATRCSMSIPVFFFAPEIEGRQVFDGGLRNNFPLTRFLQDEPKKPFIALYLGEPDYSGRRWFWSELLDIWISGEEREAVDSHAESVVVIDTAPVGTVDFGLTDLEKEFLLKVGKAAALRFLQTRRLDNGPDAETVQAAHREAEDLRRAIKQRRRRRRLVRALLLAVLLIAAVLAFWIFFAVL